LIEYLKDEVRFVMIDGKYEVRFVMIDGELYRL